MCVCFEVINIVPILSGLDLREVMCGSFPVPSHSTQPADLVELLAGLGDRHVIVVVPKEQERS